MDLISFYTIVYTEAALSYQKQLCSKLCVINIGTQASIYAHTYWTGSAISSTRKEHSWCKTQIIWRSWVLQRAYDYIMCENYIRIFERFTCTFLFHSCTYFKLRSIFYANIRLAILHFPCIHSLFRNGIPHMITLCFFFVRSLCQNFSLE